MAEKSGEIDPHTIVDEVLAQDKVVATYALRSLMLGVAVDAFENAKQARRPHCIRRVKQDIMKSIRSCPAYLKAKSNPPVDSTAVTKLMIRPRRDVWTGTLLA